MQVCGDHSLAERITTTFPHCHRDLKVYLYGWRFFDIIFFILQSAAECIKSKAQANASSWTKTKMCNNVKEVRRL